MCNLCPRTPIGSNDDLTGELRLARNRAAINGGILDLALVVALVDLEVAMVTPILIPAVCNQPVWCTIFSTPAHDLDGMTTEHRVSDGIACFVDTRLVVGETLVDKEHACDWPILIDVLHHLVRTAGVSSLLADAVASSTTMLAS